MQVEKHILHFQSTVQAYAGLFITALGIKILSFIFPITRYNSILLKYLTIDLGISSSEMRRDFSV